MEELRLPWNGKEGILYGGIIAAITAFIMMFFNICRQNGGVELEYLRLTLITLPLLWVVVMLIMNFFVGRTANIIIRRYTQPSDSVNSHIALNIICCVTMMSMIMTIVGPSIGSVMEGSPSLDCVMEWPYNWPVNFCAAFWVEMALAQPVARMVMKRKHIRFLKSQKTGGAADE